MGVSPAFTVGRTTVFKVGTIKFILMVMRRSQCAALPGLLSNSVHNILIQAGPALKHFLILTMR